jgi:hypothetical protein
MKAEAKSDPSILPDSRVQLNAQAKSPVNQPAQTPPDTPLPPASSKAPGTTSSPASEIASPPTPTKRGWLRIVLPVLLICILLGSGLGFFLFTHQSTTAPVATDSIVGQAFFVSSGQVNQTTNQGSNDEFQIDLQNIPNPQSGKSYYAWLLPDKSQVEAAPILLGTLPVNHGVVHFSYMGDSNHSNLLAITSRFLITEQDANITVNVPSPDLATWRYYAELPQTPAPGQTYSLLDHLRHLLAIDPELEKFHLHGGLNIWTYRNIQKILEWAGSARDDWSTKDFSSIHRQIVSILDYLDGATLVQQDVPAGTPILADRTISQVGLLELHAGQEPPGYLYHIALHLNGVLSSPGPTQYQRNLATQINTGVNNVNGWLQQERQDAIQLVHMNDAQLALPSSLSLLNDMVTQANNAYMGLNNPSTGQLQSGISQVYLNVQRLATFAVKPYK